MKRLTQALGTVTTLIEETIPGILMAFTMLAVSADVIMRYGFNRPIRGVAEVGMIAFVWLVYLSAAGAARRGLHISIDFVYSRLPTRGKAALDVAVNTVIAIVLTLVLIAGIDWLTRARFSPLPTTGWSKGILTLVLVIACVLMLVHTGLHLVRAARGAIIGEYVRHSDPLAPDDFAAIPVLLDGDDQSEVADRC